MVLKKSNRTNLPIYKTISALIIFIAVALELFGLGNYLVGNCGSRGLGLGFDCDSELVLGTAAIVIYALILIAAVVIVHHLFKFLVNLSSFYKKSRPVLTWCFF